ncbi:hypothetical protein GCM10009609_65500 [Pseudonocardia aurantiaca]|uniref:Alcohol dehydrogenase catalytic domain-containing protein n=1 Tax=Pseudonocardia aurantiaca TaxID=75290 RepID=A0ABW4FSV1_9PSEU
MAFPHVPNTDVAGVITEVGEGVTGWSVGDAVVAFLPGTAPGAAAEYVAAPAEALAAAPRAGELADAAAMPLPGLTAWQSLFEHAGLKPGQGVLINGAGGAVGGYAVQLAAQAGATVTATASARSRDRIRSYGADRIVDYTATPVQQAVAGLVQHALHAGPRRPSDDVICVRHRRSAWIRPVRSRRRATESSGPIATKVSEGSGERKRCPPRGHGVAAGFAHAHRIPCVRNRQCVHRDDGQCRLGTVTAAVEQTYPEDGPFRVLTSRDDRAQPAELPADPSEVKDQAPAMVRPGIGSASAARQAGVPKGSAKYCVS